jgi:crossover junction endodeoxyribonuclease RuvC
MIELPQQLTAVVGIDPSLTSTGLAVLWRTDTNVIGVTSKGKAGASWRSRFNRIDDLTARIAGRVPSNSLVLIESPAYGTVRGASSSQHDRAGLWWALYRRLVELDCLILPVTPAVRAKYATGKGNAGKDEVLAAVVRRYPEIEVTGNDTADALILAAIGARLVNAPIEANLPKAHLAALDKLDYEGPRNAEPRPAVGAERGTKQSVEPTLF